MCRSKHRRGAQSVRQVGGETEAESEMDSEETLCVVKLPRGHLPPLKVQVLVDDCRIPMEIDTGASRSIMSESKFRKIWPKKKLEPVKVKLQTYSKEPLPVVGGVWVWVDYEGQTARLPLIVVKGDGPTLLGRDWMGGIRLNWHKIHYTPSAGLQDLLEKHDDVFQEGLGTFQGQKAGIQVDPNAKPRYCKARTLPYSLRPKVEEELERQVSEGILEPVAQTEWATPIVAVLKSDKSIRICGDFRVIVNPVAKLDRYPVPKIEDLLATLQRGRIFTKLDLRNAYQQLPLEEDSQKYVVINTTKGLFKYKRLPYGISSAPAIFQRVMEHLLQGIRGVVVATLRNLISTCHFSEGDGASSTGDSWGRCVH